MKAMDLQGKGLGLESILFPDDSDIVADALRDMLAAKQEEDVTAKWPDISHQWFYSSNRYGGGKGGGCR